MDANDTARTLIEIGGLLLALMGASHAALSVADDFKPTQFTPLSDDVRRGMTDTSVRFSRHLNMWRSWIGFNISHGAGVFSFGATYSLIAVHDFSLLVAFQSLMLLGILVSFVYFLLALRYWFYGPAIGTGIGFACFAVAYLLV
jgi:hypothetical protein